ncbi:MAG TPA: carbamoyltransferase HypF, partial [Cyanobium sp.]|nr:carbamoyltransferase HypF [Cyanobium sp.]
LAQAQPWPLRPVQHHLAHGLAVMAEHGLEPPLLVVAFDGLGYGVPLEGDDTAIAAAGHRLWGGELLLIGAEGPTHLGGLLPFPLPGGEKAMAEPRRSALGLLAAAGSCSGIDAFEHPGAHHTLAAFGAAERALVRQAVTGGCNSPLSSSMGRLFDAAASLLGLCQQLSYEGEGGLRLQGAASQAPGEKGSYPLPLLPAEGPPAAGGPPLGRLDWRPLLGALLADIAAGEAPARCAARFHRGLAQAVATAAVVVAERWGCRQVALAGGCFQNRLLLELAIDALRTRDLEPFWAEALPCNDGGLALGQVWAARCLRWPAGSGGETCRQPGIPL